MKNALIVAALGLVVWFAYTRAVGPSTTGAPPPAAPELDDASDLLSSEPRPQFSCDGRTHCSQMISCEEAEFFLAELSRCRDGRKTTMANPCETQWCGDSR